MENIYTASDRLVNLIDIPGDIVAFSITEVDETRINGIVVNDLSQLREVPCEPLLEAHSESVDVFVHLLDEGDCLGDGLVLTVNILGAL